MGGQRKHPQHRTSISGRDNHMRRRAKGEGGNDKYSVTTWGFSAIA